MIINYIKDLENIFIYENGRVVKSPDIKKVYILLVLIILMLVLLLLNYVMLVKG